MRLSIHRFKFLKKRLEKKEGKRITNHVISNNTGIGVSSLDDYVRSKNGIQNPISEKSARILSKYLDCHPGYLTGTVNEKVESVFPLLSLSEEEYVNKTGLSRDLYQNEIKYYAEVTDDEGFFIPPYRDYEYEEKRGMNVQDFKQWLLSINMFENPDFLDGFPSNAVLENILSRMSYGEFQVFQGHIIDSVSEYLTTHGYIADYGGYLTDDSNLSEEDVDKLEDEANKRWVKKLNEGYELYRKKIEEE